MFNPRTLIGNDLLSLFKIHFIPGPVHHFPYFLPLFSSSTLAEEIFSFCFLFQFFNGSSFIADMRFWQI